MERSESQRRAIAARLHGIYVIVGPSPNSTKSATDVARAAIDGGACAIQLRDKASPRADIVRTAEELVRVCAQARVLSIVNDDPHLAARVGANGVHVGQSDACVDMCRSALDAHQLVGRSNATVDEVRESIQLGADYVAVGAVFESKTKLDTRPAGIATLDAAVRISDVPVVAIGGINVDNIGHVASTGVEAVCVASAVTDAADPERATRELLRKFISGKP